MLKHLFLSAACLLFSCAWGNVPCVARHSPSVDPIQIRINVNVELLGFVYFLGYEGRESETNPDYAAKNRTRYAYGLDLYRRYKAYENSRHLAVVIGFAENIWLDYLINLLLQLKNFPDASLDSRIGIGYYERFSATKDPVEARKNAAIFVEAMNALYREVDFGAYLEKSSRLYQNAVYQVKAGLPDSTFIPAMEAFYQGHFDSYTLVPSLTIPAQMGFGAMYSQNNQSHASHVFGAFAPPQFADTSNLDMGFDDKNHLLELSTHEFGHSFVNPAVDQLPEKRITNAQKLFSPIAEAMADQGYTSWKACLYEHFVRAGEVVIGRNLGRKQEAEHLMDHYFKDRKFVYLPVIVEELEKYDTNQNISYASAVAHAMRRLENENSIKP